MDGRAQSPPVNPCDDCGACCREAFDSVPVGPQDERVAEMFPDLIRVHEDGWRDLRRVPGKGEGTRCICLRGDGASTRPYRCTIYADRPINCRDLEAGSENCALARRRVGLPPLSLPLPGPGR
jgi:uncharacterized protein